MEQTEKTHLEVRGRAAHAPGVSRRGLGQTWHPHLPRGVHGAHIHRGEASSRSHLPDPQVVLKETETSTQSFGPPRKRSLSKRLNDGRWFKSESSSSRGSGYFSRARLVV